ncbi:putative membrane protein [Actinobacillus pleuropneumoniae serovar 7 str. AP76]|uniref:Putative membrane protein n=1 Tax=Actinobacillus pleuropneumoniae serotype 7 (strain AP76) TaxID=537457 RepID=B3H289_ACTP7|nr:putative membrane protein [Actinobacillus pleuropneumoniae serovar 7 str. AP76]
MQNQTACFNEAVILFLFFANLLQIYDKPLQ